MRRLCRSGDKDLDSRLELSLVARHVTNDRDIRRHDDFLLTIFVLQGQRPPIDPGDSLLNIGVSHGALRLKIPLAVPPTGSTHRVGENIDPAGPLAPLSLWHSRNAKKPS